MEPSIDPRNLPRGTWWYISPTGRLTTVCTGPSIRTDVSLKGNEEGEGSVGSEGSVWVIVVTASMGTGVKVSVKVAGGAIGGNDSNCSARDVGVRARSNNADISNIIWAVVCSIATQAT